MGRGLQGVWGGVLVGAMATLVPVAQAQQDVVVQALECRGDEPSWRFDANRTSALYGTPGAKGMREVVFRGSVQTLSFLTPAAIVWRGDSTHLPRETLVATLREEACRSTMADGPAATHRAVLSVRAGEAAAGCCIVRRLRRARRAVGELCREARRRLGAFAARPAAGDQSLSGA